MNNNTGRELKDFKIQFVIKKDVTTTGDITGLNFGRYLNFVNKPNSYYLGFELNNNYLAPTLTRQDLPSLTEVFDMSLHYGIRDKYVDMTGYDKLKPSWFVDGDVEVRVLFLTKDVVLAEQVLQLKKHSVRVDYKLSLVHKNFEDFLVTSSYPVYITDDNSGFANLEIVPVNSGVRPIPQFPARFIFHLPDGVSFVRSEWDKKYPGVPAVVEGRDLTITLHPSLVGSFRDDLERFLKLKYLSVPIKFEGDVKSSYEFTVDSDDIPNIKMLNVDNKLVRRVDLLDFIKDHSSWSYTLGNGDYINIDSGQSIPAQAIQGVRFRGVQRGLRLKQFHIKDRLEGTLVYGIKPDGTRVELHSVVLDGNDRAYYEKGYSYPYYVYKDVDNYEYIEVVYKKEVGRSNITWTFEITDKDNLQDRLPITYRVGGREKTVSIERVNKKPRFEISLDRDDTTFLNTDWGSLYTLDTTNTLLKDTPYWEHSRGYVLYKYEQGMELPHSSTSEKLVKRETVGGYIYDLTEIKDISAFRSTQHVNFLPVFQDGKHRLTGKIFFNHDNFVPDSIADVTVRQPYDDTRSLKDNYDSSTNKEYVINFTYQSPRSLQVAALINGVTSINVLNTDDVYTFEHYLMNKSTQSYSGVEGEITLPKGVVLTELVTTDSRYKVLYKVGDSWVENPANLEDVTDFKVVPKVEGTSLGLQDIVKTTAKVKVKDVMYDDKLVIDSKMTVNGASTKAQDVVLNIKDVKLADGTLEVQYVNVNGDFLKEDILQGRHGTNYEVNVTDFEKGGKNYGFDHVDGDLNGSYEGTKAKVVKVYMKEKPRVYELPVSGKLDFIWVLFSLLGILVITGKHKKIKV